MDNGSGTHTLWIERPMHYILPGFATAMLRVSFDDITQRYALVTIHDDMDDDEVEQEWSSSYESLFE